MSELFTTIKIEILVNGEWVDLTPDVLHSPAPRVTGMGITDNGISNRIGDVGTFTFSLDNSVKNSAGVQGYYTPLRSVTRTGWVHGAPIHLYFEYDGRRVYKFFGYIDSDGIDVVAELNGDQTVRVRCSNWMRKASTHELNNVPYLTNKLINQAVPYLLIDMAIQPQSILYYTGNEAFPYIFDTVRSTTKAIAELNKLAISEFGRVFIAGNDTTGEELVVENRQYRADYFTGGRTVNNGDLIPVKSTDITSLLTLFAGGNLLLIGGGDLLLNEWQYADFVEGDIINMQVSYSKHMSNSVTFKVYPRTIDAAATTVLYTLGAPITLTAGEQVFDVGGAYTDSSNRANKVNGIEMVTPVATTDYQMFQNSDGTGTDYTTSLEVTVNYSNTASVNYALKNNSGVTAYVTKLQARGKGVYIYNVLDKKYDLASSQNRHGVISSVIDLPYIPSTTTLFEIADKTNTIWENLLAGVGIPEFTVDEITMLANESSKAMFAFMFLEPSMLIKVFNTITEPQSGGFVSSLFINGYGFEILDMKYVMWSPTLKKAGRW